MSKMRSAKIILLIACVSLLQQTSGQKLHNANLVYVNDSGTLCWTKTKKEVSFFGVNYTAPFAYSYRALHSLGVDIKETIRGDVWAMSRLCLDAFRVHVWDTEISDTLGNLLENDHLVLFDFLLAELSKRNIKAIITPIAFWGNGYPEKDELTPGFSRKYGKGNATTNEDAIKAQENYLRQFFKHINQFTGLTYGQDTSVIAIELNNEPSHSGPKTAVTAYINRLAAAARGAGWNKPVYYNISQSPFYADAVAAAQIDGVSFQWYPTGLVAAHEQKGNLLLNVDHYTIPYDTISAYRTKTKMVYEFDAADVLSSFMYPAIARSFREAGFQWATQFAYDPAPLAYANTEYQTHYLNLYYTPSKAISLLIASKAFHRLPRNSNFGSYPDDSVFDAFRVSYKNAVSEMNTAEEFYYSNATNTKPLDAARLRHLAGVGNSSLVQYAGKGAFFLDRVDNGVWRLQVLPDAITIRDPFEKASPEKEVVRLEWFRQKMQIHLPELNDSFEIHSLTLNSNNYAAALNGEFDIFPGSYILVNKSRNWQSLVKKIDLETLGEYYSPQPTSNEPIVAHTAYREVSSNKPLLISATIAGVASADKIALQVNRTGNNQWRMLPMRGASTYTYVAEVPADLLLPGELSYRIVIQRADREFCVFPGDHNKDPLAWDNINDDSWHVPVAATDAHLLLYNATFDRAIITYPSFQRGFQVTYTSEDDPHELLLKMSANEMSGNETIGFQQYIGDRWAGRETENFDNLLIRVKSGNASKLTIKVIAVNKNGFAYSQSLLVQSSLQDIVLLPQNWRPDSFFLLPRPYPGFMPLKFRAHGSEVFNWNNIEKLQLFVSSADDLNSGNRSCSMEIQSIWLEKSTSLH